MSSGDHAGSARRMRSPSPRIIGFLATVLTYAACGGDGPTQTLDDGTAQLRVLHTAAATAIDVTVGGQTIITNLARGSVTDFTTVPAGSQQVVFHAAGTAASGSGTILNFTADDTVTVFTIDSSTVINPWVLTDSGAVVTPDKSKLRVVHFAAEAPAIDVWRTQPDFPSLITIMFPFPYRAVSPYLQSDPGTWTVLVTTERRDAMGIPVLGDSLWATGPIEVTGGGLRTVVLFDREGGGITSTVIEP